MALARTAGFKEFCSLPQVALGAAAGAQVGARASSYRLRLLISRQSPDGGIGRHAGLRSLWPQGCGGSSPLSGTNRQNIRTYFAFPASFPAESKLLRSRRGLGKPLKCPLEACFKTRRILRPHVDKEPLV